MLVGLSYHFDLYLWITLIQDILPNWDTVKSQLFIHFYCNQTLDAIFEHISFLSLSIFINILCFLFPLQVNTD